MSGATSINSLALDTGIIAMPPSLGVLHKPEISLTASDESAMNQHC
jgi:hypothetical protein